MKMFDAGKSRMIVLPYGEKNYDDILSRFHLVPDRQTDRRTDIFAISLSRVSMLTRDKNRRFIDCLQLLDTKTRDDEKNTSFSKSCICVFWVNRPTQNLTWS